MGRVLSGERGIRSAEEGWMFEDELAFARELADEAGRIALSFFRGSFEVQMKVDRTPVTEADLAIEAMIRGAVHKRYPGDAVLGEEGGSEGEAPRRWIVDPIDGTKNFADGIQIWATLIALAVDDVPVLGIANAAALCERYVAVRGLGARMNDEPIHVSGTNHVARAAVMHAGLPDWLDGDYGPALLAVAREARRDRGFGDFWGHLLVARGSADVMFEPELATWDWAALQVIVQEAGGRMTQFDGSPLAHGKSVLTTNGLLHPEITARLRDGRRPLPP